MYLVQNDQSLPFATPKNYNKLLKYTNVTHFTCHVPPTNGHVPRIPCTFEYKSHKED